MSSSNLLGLGLGLGPLPPPSPPPSVPLPLLGALGPVVPSKGDVLRQVEVVRPAEPAVTPATLTNSELLFLRICEYVKARRALLALCVLATGVWVGLAGAAMALAVAWVIERVLSSPTRILRTAILTGDVRTVQDALNHWQERYSHLPESEQRELLDAIDVDAFEELEHELAYVRLPLCDSMKDAWLVHWEEGFGDLSINEQCDLLSKIQSHAILRGNTKFADQITQMRENILAKAPGIHNKKTLPPYSAVRGMT